MSGEESRQQAETRGGLCLDHDTRISRNEREIEKLEKTDKELDTKREDAVRRVHKRIDLMQWSVIGAMFTVIVEGLVLVATLVTKVFH
jgi:hypothetical protein